MTHYEVVPEVPAVGTSDAEPDETPAAEAGIPDIVARLAEMTAALLAVQQELRSADDRAASRERIIDRLHEDNQKLRSGERRLVLMPLLTDLQRLRNDLLRQAATVPADLTADRMSGLLASYAHSVELTLERGGVAPIRPAPGDTFDGGRHRPSDVVDAAAPSDDGRVAVVLADGYEDATSGKTLTPATVRVYRWTESATATLPEESHV